jgi:hypothetical protein
MQRIHLSALALGGAVLLGACAGGGAQTARPSSPASSQAGATAPSSTAPQTTAPQSPAAASPAASPAASVGAETPATSAMPTMDHGSISPESPAASDGTGSATDIMSAAANLRTDLNYLLGEHQILAAKATGAAIGGRQDQFEAYGGLLNTNGTDLGAAIGSIYGTEAQDEFNRIWSAHNGFFVDYTTGAAGDDQALADQAVNDLNTIYVPEFSAFLVGATGLPEDAVVGLVSDHVEHTIGVIDAQVSGDQALAYEEIRSAYAHVQEIGDALAPAIAEQNGIEGDAGTPAVGFRVALNQLLQEHMFLASFATDAAIGGRSDEFDAAGAALNANGTDIGAAIGSLYGMDAQDEFNRIWSAHNGFFVDYTTGVATDDMAMQDKAVEDLTTIYVPEFSAFLAGATGLPEDTLAELITEHVLTTKAVVDAQGSGDAAAAAEADRTAAMHMRMMGDPLAQAIVAAMPDAFTQAN